MSSYLAGRFPHGVRTPEALLSAAPVTQAFPPGTEEQGQKSRQKNVVLPAFQGTARGRVRVGQPGSRFMKPAHAGRGAHILSGWGRISETLLWDAEPMG